MAYNFEVFFSIFILFSTFYITNASDNIKGDILDRGAHSENGGLWFGPRLGKRSLQIMDEDKSKSFLRLLEAADALQFYYDQMQSDGPQDVSKKVITPKSERAAGQKSGGKKYENFDFTPRLGRKLPEELQTPDEENILDSLVLDTRNNNYFSPRLGRNYKFSPRLGREFYDFYPGSQMRVTRSIKKKKSN